MGLLALAANRTRFLSSQGWFKDWRENGSFQEHSLPEGNALAVGVIFADKVICRGSLVAIASHIHARRDHEFIGLLFLRTEGFIL